MIKYTRLDHGRSTTGQDTLPVDQTQIASNSKVHNAISGDLGYGTAYTYTLTTGQKYTYFIRSGKVWCYGPDLNKLIFFQFGSDYLYQTTADKILLDICQIADVYFYALDKQMIFKQHNNATQVSVTAKVIQSKSSYTDVDFTLNISSGLLSQTELDYLNTYYNAHYVSNEKRIKKMKLINLSAKILPGESLLLNGVDEGIVKAVTYDPNDESVIVVTDRFGLD